MAAPSPFRIVHTVCSHDCPDSCAVLVTVNAEGRAVNVQSDPIHPITQGFLCGKVAKYLDRVLYPLKRKPPDVKEGADSAWRCVPALHSVGWRSRF